MKLSSAKRGFTLVELLTAAIIVTILVVIATPLYEKTIERSHMAELRSVLDGLQEAKLFAMDKMEIETFDPSHPKPTLYHLNVSFAPEVDATSFQTKSFTYSLAPEGADAHPNGVCAVRNGGPAAGTIFYYYHPTGSPGNKLLCIGGLCEDVYGLEDSSDSANISCE